MILAPGSIDWYLTCRFIDHVLLADALKSIVQA